MGTPVNPVTTALGVANILSSVGLGFLTAHHQKAVVNENNVLGSAVPAARASFQKIVDTFSAGMIDAGTAVSRLQDAVNTFKNASGGIRKQSGKAGETGDPKAGGKCNAACVWLFTLQGEADELKSQINAGTNQDPSAKGMPTTGQRVAGTDKAGNATQSFSLAPSLTGNNLGVVIGGVVLFFAALAVAAFLRHTR